MIVKIPKHIACILLFYLCMPLFMAPVYGQELNLLGTYQTGIFDEGGAEIPAYDKATKRLFVTNAAHGVIDVLDISNPANPTLLFSFDVSGVLPDADITSVAAQNGLVGVTAEDENGQGKVVFFDADVAAPPTQAKAIVPVGSLPDMLVFTPDGTKVLVANEGEPEDDGQDPEGSVSIIQTSDFSVATADFKAFNGQAAALRAKGVRIYQYAESVAQDLEPEGIAVSPDGTTAFITLQENNAFAVLDIASATIQDILPAGYKDHSKNQPELKLYTFDEPPLDAAKNILFGGLSGLYFERMGEDGKYHFITVPDRGPNGELVEVREAGSPSQSRTARPFLIPDYQAQVIRFSLDPQSGDIEITEKINLTRQDGVTPISGLPNIPGVDELPVEPVEETSDFMDEAGNYYKVLPYDAYGADLEGIVINPQDQTFWMVDEYRPAIYHFQPDGKLIHRYVPQGTAALAGEPAGTYGEETLPAVYSTRRSNRGFEAVALDTDKGILYAFIQTPLSNPDEATGEQSNVIRVLGINPANGQPVAEYVYLLENPAYRDAIVDKIGDAAYDAATQKFYVLERDSRASPMNKKFVFEMELKGATNVLDVDVPSLTGKTLEASTADALLAHNIQPVAKRKILNLPSLGYLPSDKPEGLTVLPNGDLAVLNDNDFGLEGPAVSTIGLGIIAFSGKSNALDASDKDGIINISNWPVLGMYQPDGIAAFEANGQLFYLTANEGDAREYDFYEEEVRIGDEDVVLDPETFSNADELKQDQALGRLNITAENGDIDGDGDYDRMYTLGGRSFSIWDAYGNQVFDSGDDFEQIIAQQFPDYFNASNDDNDFDSRSDNKGPEPEGVALGIIDGRTYAFIGMERMSGVMMYDVTDPKKAQFITYFNNRNFEADVETEAAGDLGPEGLLFIAKEDSPTGTPLLVVAHEISGSTSIMHIDDVPPTSIKFSFVNAETQMHIQSLQDGDVINLTELGDPRLSIKANANPINVDSVKLSLSGAINRTRVERYYPYALFGDEPNTGGSGRKLVGLKWKPGAYTLTATPYVAGSAGTAYTISFQVIHDLAVQNFTLINADTDQAIGTIKDGDVIDLSVLGNPQLSIRANTTPLTVERVTLAIDGPVIYTQEEHFWPYALFGDEPKAGANSRDYTGLSWLPGAYTIKATPLLNDKAGKPMMVSFTIIDGNAALQSSRVEVYPIPAHGELHIRYEGGDRKADLSLVDFYGNVLLTKPLSEQQTVETMDLSSFKKGFYFLKIVSEEGVEVKRVILE